MINIKGFTLLETLIAMIIIAGGLLVLVSSWSGSTMRLKKIQTKYEITQLLERKMGEIEFKYRHRSINEIPEQDEGDFGSDYPDYTWKINSKKMEFPDLTSFFKGDSREIDELTIMIAKQLQQILNQSVKEVTVTVTLNQSQPYSQSITTLFVEPAITQTSQSKPRN